MIHSREKQREEQSQKIERLLEQTDKLSKWEDEFLRSLTDQLDNGRFLSVRQIEILDRIYDEKA